MNLSNLVSEENILVPLASRTKSEVILELIQLLKDNNKIVDERSAYESVMAREALSSTGLGHGIAVPHGKSDSVSKLVLAIGISPEGIEFQAIDGKPSHLFFLILAPPNCAGQHIEVLAEIGKLANNSVLLRMLKQAKKVKEVMDILLD